LYARLADPRRTTGDLLAWWKRFKPNKSTLPAALVATILCGFSLIAIWAPNPQIAVEMERYGHSIARTLAQGNAAYLLHKERIELAVVANQTARFPEVAGVQFYTASNDIIAMSGNDELGQHFTAPATMDDTITGYVSVVLDPQAFAPAPRPIAWLLTIGILLAAPFISLGIMQLSARGNRSLPIVSVPEPATISPQESYCIVVNLHNKLALGRRAQVQALDDALVMAQEVSAIYPGFALKLDDRGIAIFLDSDAVTPANAIYASALTQQLLKQFETEGEFRCFLCRARCPGPPADIDPPTQAELAEHVAFDDLLVVAALARSETTLMCNTTFSTLGEEQHWGRHFEHPLLDDMPDVGALYAIDALPPQQEQLVANQAMLILGFNAASA